MKKSRVVEVVALLQWAVSRWAQAAAPPTFGELGQDWLSRVASQRVCPDNERRQMRHLAPLWGLREGELTKARIETLFGRLVRPVGKLGASTLNKLRSTGRLVIRDAQGNGLWRGPNPFDLVRRLRQPKLVHPTLTCAEVRRVLRCLAPPRRRLVKAMVLMGLRPGEALGLLRVDVRLGARTVLVRRSNGRAQTKTGRERELPIHRELVADLRAALRQGASAYVFPRADGQRSRESTHLSPILRRALEEAGVDKRMRFYDLRHTSATLHRQAGCDPLVVRELLGHASRSMTDDYTHLDAKYRRAELSKLTLTR